MFFLPALRHLDQQEQDGTRISITFYAKVVRDVPSWWQWEKHNGVDYFRAIDSGHLLSAFCDLIVPLYLNI